MAGDFWSTMPFDQAVQVNPSVRLERGSVYPFVDMQAVDSGSRIVGPSELREFKGGGSRFMNGDTLMARITPCLENGKIARYAASKGEEVGHGSTEFIVIRGRPNVTDNGFAYYLTKWDGICQYCISQMTGSSGRQRVPTSALSQREVTIPPLREQQAIACILGTLDEKIELNRQLNRTLEETARAIFKSWFVDFDPVRAKVAGQQTPGIKPEIAALFPDAFEESKIGEIPKGWRVGSLGTIAQEVRDAVSPSEIEADCPYIALEHIPKRCIALDSWDVADDVASGKLRFRRGDILFGKLRPYFHKVGPAPIDGVCSTDIVVARPLKECWYGLVAGHMTDNAFVAYTERGSTGTKMPRTNWQDMAAFTITVPSTDLAKRHTQIVLPMLEKVNAGIMQSRTLAALRDALLPKLISGELPVLDAVRIVRRYA